MEDLMEDLTKVKLLEYLLSFKGVIGEKIYKIENTPHYNFSKKERYERLNTFGLCDDKNQTIYNLLNQEFNNKGLKYYNSYGELIVHPTAIQRVCSYRFKNYNERLEFVENLIKNILGDE